MKEGVAAGRELEIGLSLIPRGTRTYGYDGTPTRVTCGAGRHDHRSSLLLHLRLLQESEVAHHHPSRSGGMLDRHSDLGISGSHNTWRYGREESLSHLCCQSRAYKALLEFRFGEVAGEALTRKAAAEHVLHDDSSGFVHPGIAKRVDNWLGREGFKATSCGFDEAADFKAGCLGKFLAHQGPVNLEGERHGETQVVELLEPPTTWIGESASEEPHLLTGREQQLEMNNDGDDRRQSYIALNVPEIDRLTDDDLARFAHMRDGRWSNQTKSLLAAHGVEKLDLNRGWAWTRMGWTCPCCSRTKPQIARVSEGGVLLCRLEFHHDHLGDLAKRVFMAANPADSDQASRIQASRAWDALLPLVERFETTLVCIDCNLAEGRAKAELRNEVDANFSFTPTEIASFIEISPNRLHEIRLRDARDTWNAAREDFEDRIDFARRVAHRVARGRHRREFVRGDRHVGPLEDRDIIYRIFRGSVPRGYRHRIGEAIDARSTASNSSGSSPKPKAQVRARPPTEAEFAQLDKDLQRHKTWSSAGNDWRCPSCDRSRRGICRQSRRGRWTAHIHRISEFLIEDDEERLVKRRLLDSSTVIVGSHRHVLICQDCRNVISELMRRSAGLREECLTVRDLRDLVGGVPPHTAPDVDYDRALAFALANKRLLQGIENYRDHRNLALEVRSAARAIMLATECSREEACSCLAHERAALHPGPFEEACGHVRWLLQEAERLLLLEAGGQVLTHD